MPRPLTGPAGVNPATVSRREFVAAAGATLALGGGVPLALAGTQDRPAESKPSGEWFDRPMRWVQLVLAENDPGRYDRDFWLKFFRRVHADAACLSAGGCVAYYPTAIKYHHRSAWMKEGTDPFGELVDGCRKLGMIVVARTDPHAIREDAAEAHPEWVAVDEQGKKRRHWAAPDRWVTCAFGNYNFQFMTEVTEEIVRRYHVDGIFSNRWQGHGVCYCDFCRTSFREFCGLDLPRTADPQQPAYRNWIEWSSRRLFELWRLWDERIRKVNPRACFIPNCGGGSMTTLDMKTIGRLAPTLFADRQSRHGLMPPWANGKSAKEFRSALGPKPIAGIASLGIDDEHRWKDSVTTTAELRIWLAEGIANGLRPWVCKFCGTVYDRRWMPVVEKLYDWHWRNQRYLRNQQNLARVAMVYSQQTGTYYGGEQKHRRVEEHELGMYQALVEARIPFEMVHDRMLDPEQVDRFKLLILPNIAALSDGQCEQLRRYVGRGGSILATFETSLYDEWGKRRADYGLADVLGVSFTGRIDRDVKNAYIRINAGTRHPILRGLEDAGRIINTVQRVGVKGLKDPPDLPLTQIPSYPDLPMEEVYPRIEETNVPEVFLGEVGRGRVVYFPGDIDRTFWEVLCADHGIVLRNAIAWAANEDPPVTVTGPGMLDVTVWRQKESMTVHLVNLTNPMTMKGPYRELIPCPAQSVRVRLPQGSRAGRVRLLVADQTPSVEQREGHVSLTVPSVLDHEVVAIELEAAGE